MRRSNRSEIRPGASGSMNNLLPAIVGIVLSFGITISLFIAFSTTHEESPAKKNQNAELQWRTSPNRKNITNEDLARLQKLTKWVVRLPDDLSSDDAVGISMKTSKGNKMFNGTSNFQPGSLISVFLEERDQKFHWSIISNSGTITRSTTSVDQDRQGLTRLYASNKNTLVPGAFLIKGTDKPEKNRSNKLMEGEFAFTVEIRRNNDE